MSLSLLRPRPLFSRPFTALLASSLLALGCSNSDSNEPTPGSGGAAGSANTGESGRGAAATGAAASQCRHGAHLPWEWTGIIGTGQSLSVGEPDGVRNTPAAAARSTTQPFNNLQAVDGQPAVARRLERSVAAARAVDRADRAPLDGVSQLLAHQHRRRNAHAAMANQITTLVQAGGRHGLREHAQRGRRERPVPVQLLNKGADTAASTGHAYEATLIETRAITRLARPPARRTASGRSPSRTANAMPATPTYATQLHPALHRLRR